MLGGVVCCLGMFDVYYDATYRDTPLDPKYNQEHIPGANARGTNFVATHDRVYIVEDSTCHALDPKTGQTLQDIELPADEAPEMALPAIDAAFDLPPLDPAALPQLDFAPPSQGVAVDPVKPPVASPVDSSSARTPCGWASPSETGSS